MTTRKRKGIASTTTIAAGIAETGFRDALARSGSDPVLFLDFDGVLGSRRVWDQNLTRRWTCPAGWLDPIHIARLNRLVRQSHAGVVITTSWRKYLGADSVGNVLHACGFTGDVIGATRVLGEKPEDWRCAEIGEWLVQHASLRRWVVVDDLDLPIDPARFVRTNMEVGLTDADVDRAVGILGRA